MKRSVKEGEMGERWRGFSFSSVAVANTLAKNNLGKEGVHLTYNNM